MHQSPTQRMSGAIRMGEVETIQELLRSNPELLTTSTVGPTWLHLAVRRNNVAVVEALVRSGIDVNASGGEREDNPLCYAVGAANIEVARWLLDHGAMITPTSADRWGGTLIRAVNSGSLEMVRLLLERGAEVNGWYGSPPKNALSHALAYGHSEIADLLRAYGATLPPEPPPADPADLRNGIIAHVEGYLGPVRPTVLSEIVSGTVGITIHAVPARPGQTCLTLFTTGMSEKAMTVPPGGEAYRFAELLIHLPEDWPLTDAALLKPEYSWPVGWLRRTAHYPHDNKTWLNGPYTVLSNGDPPEPLGPNTTFTALLALTQESEFGQHQARDGRMINFYTLFPLYTEERDLVLSKGPAHLLTLFENHAISTMVDTSRINVARALNEKKQGQTPNKMEKDPK